MDKDYARRYADLYRRHWWWRAREAVVIDALRRHEPPGGWPAILDVGCGDGLLFDVLDRFGAVVEGVEPSSDTMGSDAPHAARIYRTPFDESFSPGRRYSLMLMLDVLEHLPDAVGALRRVAALLDPGGVLIVTVPAFRQLWTSHDDINHHQTRYTKASLRAEAQRAGFELLEARYFFHWTFPAKLAVRLYERTRRGGRGDVTLPAVPPAPLNRALYWLARAEYLALGRAPVPFGSSLLAVARPVATGAERATAGDAAAVTAGHGGGQPAGRPPRLSAPRSNTV